MKNKVFLAILLLTPILVVTFSSLYFSLGYSPEGTKNNGIFFKSYFNFDQFSTSKDNNLIEFEDGKWVMGVYITDPAKADASLYLMRQLNVALNRDIFRAKRVAFFSNQLIKNDIDNLIAEYPRTDLVAEYQVLVACLDNLGRVSPKKLTKDCPHLILLLVLVV